MAVIGTAWVQTPIRTAPADLWHVLATTTQGVTLRYEARERAYCEEMAERRLIVQPHIDRVRVVRCGPGCFECVCLASR